MVKTLLLEIVKHYMTKEKKSYSRPFIYFFVLLGLALLIVANSIYFYNPDSIQCAFWMVSGTLSIAIAVIIECWKCYRKEQEKHQIEDIFNQPVVNFLSIILSQLRECISIKTIFRFLPIIIRFIPASVLTVVIYKIIKRSALSQIKSLLSVGRK